MGIGLICDGGGVSVATVTYRTTNRLPEGVPAAVIDQGCGCVILVNAALTLSEACAVLGPLITEYVRQQQTWSYLPEQCPESA